MSTILDKGLLILRLSSISRCLGHGDGSEPATFEAPVGELGEKAFDGGDLGAPHTLLWRGDQTASRKNLHFLGQRTPRRSASGSRWERCGLPPTLTMCSRETRRSSFSSERKG